jgi:pimeloyl-ACP methyl ester carboxylesterase
MNVTEVAGVRVRQWGREDGSPLVYWHALNPFGALQLIEAGPVWAERGFRVLAIAAPGGGDSPALADPDSYRPKRLAQLTIDVADALAIDRFAFVGSSWGASIGVHLAAAHSKRVGALVLLDAGHTDVELEQTREELERELTEQQATWEFASWDEYLDAVRPRVRGWRPALEQRYRAAMAAHGGRIVPRASAPAAAWALHGVASEPPSSTHAALRALELPILLVIASESGDEEAARRFQAAVPHADVRTVDGGHDIIADAATETIPLVANWLRANG